MDWRLALLSVIILLAYMVGATTGFGGAMIAVALAIHLYSVEFLVPILVILNLAISIYIVARHHDGIESGKLFRFMLPLAALGLPIGILIFSVAKTNTLNLVLGVFIVCFSLFELAILLGPWKDREREPMSALQSSFWLFLGGVMHGMYASGGPLVVYYASRNIGEKRAFRSTLSALWLMLNTGLLIVYLCIGKVTADTVWASAILLPSLAAGIALGELLHDRLPERGFRILVFAVLLLAGISVFL
ncbi:MAG: sulfite exporter TauE/SafE family protein [Actinobacteria bacterium]|nr:sulfite exporter TauE/SafE family protein [Actinomycetota bacterium]MBU1943197.1 sulfite exporter TauE/SafE family protein [Actinomycetota bacterium]MBU2687875.1 sulfite exporter TauE/SafE family protein [Actinomycetota bacterium]